MTHNFFDMVSKIIYIYWENRIFHIKQKYYGTFDDIDLFRRNYGKVIHLL